MSTLMTLDKATASELRRIAQRRERHLTAADDALGELREAVAVALENGATLKEIAATLNLSFQRVWQLANE